MKTRATKATMKKDDLRIFAYRTKWGLTQGQLAELLGVERSVISKMEDGKASGPRSARLLMERLVAERELHA